MARKPNTDAHGNPWTEQQKLAVWQKGEPYGTHPTNVWRKDKCGLLMKYSEHDNRNSDVGWEVDHIDPISNGGPDYISNLQPLNWKNNADKGNKLNWNCPSSKI